MYAVDLFAGAGGFSLGLEDAGFHVVTAIEVDSWAAKTYQNNFHSTRVIQHDIRDVDPRSCAVDISGKGRHIDAVIAGAPCQGFSESNRRFRAMDNPVNLLYREFLRFVRILEPRIFIFENVAGILTVDKAAALRRILHQARRLGYSVTWFEANAARFGVPQLRRRVFVVGHRGDPIPAPRSRVMGEAAYVTVYDAMSDLPELMVGASDAALPYATAAQSRYQRLMRRGAGALVTGNLVSQNSELVLQRYQHIRPGQNWSAIPEELMRNYKDRSRCHTGIYHRLSWNAPAKVLGNFRKNMLIHPAADRGLSIREAARLQSFPDRFTFAGTIGFQQQQVANAVPPLLAKAVAGHIVSSLRRFDSQ